MDNLKIKVENKIKELKEKAKANKSLEYRYLWVKVSFAVARGGYIRDIGAQAFGVFIIIRTFMDKDYIAYPSLSTIAYLSGCGVSTIQKEIATLENDGWLKKAGRVINPDGKFGNTKYRITQTDLIRGTGDVSFAKQPPLLKTTSGD